jgi:uncharacterized protein YjiS (DUF1127 family)
MREYIEQQARLQQSAETFPRLRLLVRNWLSRRNMLKLHLLDDYQLRDIGLSRHDLDRLNRQPLSLDTVWEAERLKIIASHQRPKSGDGAAG